MLSTLVNQFGAPEARARALVEEYERSNAEHTGNPFIGLVFDAHTSTAYFYLRHLGSGTFGHVVSASTDASRVPQFVVKQIKLLENSYVELVEREYKIGLLMRQQMHEDRFCEEHVVCALARFYDHDMTMGFIVFPYNTTLSLRDYLAMYLHPQMLGAEADELRQLQLIAADLVLQFLYALAVLHANSISHGDVKPSNAIVDDNETAVSRRLRLIDFGFACQFAGKDVAREIQCPNQYRTTPLYRDPLALDQRMHQVDVPTRFTKLDTYAAGKSIQCVFDPDLDLVLGYPVVRETRFMLPGLVELIERMTGERDYKPRHTQRPELTPVEAGARWRALDVRPSMAAVLTEYSNLVQRYSSDMTNKSAR